MKSISIISLTAVLLAAMSTAQAQTTYAISKKTVTEEATAAVAPKRQVIPKKVVPRKVIPSSKTVISYAKKPVAKPEFIQGGIGKIASTLRANTWTVDRNTIHAITQRDLTPRKVKFVKATPAVAKSQTKSQTSLFKGKSVAPDLVVKSKPAPVKQSPIRALKGKTSGTPLAAPKPKSAAPTTTTYFKGLVSE